MFFLYRGNEIVEFGTYYRVIFFYCLKFILFVFVLTCVRTCVYVHVPWCTCRVQSTACRSRFSLSIVWVPGTEHRSPELGAKCFVSRATSWLLIDIFSSKKYYQARNKSVFFYVQKWNEQIVKRLNYLDSLLGDTELDRLSPRREPEWRTQTGE